MRTHLALLQPLVAEFPRWLDYFVDHGPFTRPEQLTCHLKAIALRRQHLSAAAASNDSDFVKVLHDTLRAWGVGSRGSNLLPLAEFGPRLLSVSAALKPLEPLRIDADDLDVERSIGSIWKAVESIGVVRNNAPLVAGSKTLHHLLPDLVPPMRPATPRVPWLGLEQPPQRETGRRRNAALGSPMPRPSAAISDAGQTSKSCPS